VSSRLAKRHLPMGRPAIGSFSTSCFMACKNVEDFLDGGPAFGKLDEANCLLLRSSKDGNLDGIQQALEAGADINTRSPMWIRIQVDDDSMGEKVKAVPTATSLTPLMFASCEGHADSVELLLSLGAKLNLCDGDGMQALHMASEASSAECFRVLLNAGANPLAKDNFDRNAMECVPPAMPVFGPVEQKWPALLKEASLISKMIMGTVGVAEAKERCEKKSVAGGPPIASFMSISSEL